MCAEESFMYVRCDIRRKHVKFLRKKFQVEFSPIPLATEAIGMIIKAPSFICYEQSMWKYVQITFLHTHTHSLGEKCRRLKNKAHN
jgi:hypothetical protein